MTIRIGTSESGGTFHTQGAALAEVLNRTGGPGGEAVAVTAETASVGNARGLEAGEIEFGCMASNWTGRALAGTDPFTAPVALRMVAPLNAGPMFFVVRKDSDIATVADLAGRRIAVGLESSGMTQHVRTIFGVLGIPFLGIEPAWLGFADGADALAEGTVDAQFQCPVPNRVMTELAERAEVRALPFAPGQLGRLVAEVPFYRRAVLPAGAFRGHDEDIDQVGVLNVLVTHARVADAVVERVAAAMCGMSAELERLNPLFRGLGGLFGPLRTVGPAALESDGVPLHPGARAAYRAAGYLD